MNFVEYLGAPGGCGQGETTGMTGTQLGGNPVRPGGIGEAKKEAGQADVCP